VETEGGSLFRPWILGLGGCQRRASGSLRCGEALRVAEAAALGDAAGGRRRIGRREASRRAKDQHGRRDRPASCAPFRSRRRSDLEKLLMGRAVFCKVRAFCCGAARLEFDDVRFKFARLHQIHCPCKLE
jgi:hypothetical protein